MTKIKHYVHKACPVILRNREGTWQILAFRHPKAGTQLVKGTVEEDERPEETVLRELAEESGLEQTVIVQKIGTLGFRATKQHWHLFLCQPLVAPQEEWSFFTKDGGGQRFHFFWHELAAEPDETWHPQFRSALRFIRSWHQGQIR